MNNMLNTKTYKHSRSRYSSLFSYWLLFALGLSQPSIANIQEIPINPNQELNIKYFSGHLIIEGHQTSNRLTLDSSIQTGASINNRNRNTNENSFTVKALNHKNQIVLTVKSPENTTRRADFHSSELPSLRINLPRNTPIKVDHGKGNLTLSNLSAPLYIKDEDGDIHISNAQFIKIKDTAGDITLNNIGKAHNKNTKELIRIEDGSGNIYVQQIYGNISIDDGSGNIKAENVFGRLFVNDGSGDIHTNYIHHGLVIEDGSGDIVISNTPKHSIKEDSSGIVQIL